MQIQKKEELFTKKIQNIFGLKSRSILKHMKDTPLVTFRVNTITANVKPTINKLIKDGFKIKKGPFENSFIILESPINTSLSKTEPFNNGSIYIQSLSSMIPAQLISPNTGENILDLCAAPGSKTTQIANLTKNKANIVAVDNNKSRFYILKNNLDKYGVKAATHKINGLALLKAFPHYKGYFDKVLIDAPCSNEGDINLSKKDALKYWNPKLPKKISKLQKRLAIVGYNSLKTGGVLVYSTCTFSKEENEDIVNYLTNKFCNLKLLETKKTVPNGLYTGFFAAKLVKS